MTGGLMARLLARMRPRPVLAPAPPVRGVSDADRTLSRLAPPGSDWVWRPGAFDAPSAPDDTSRVVPGMTLGAGLSLFHDCPALDLTLTARAGTGAPDSPARSFAITVGAFTGSYLSLVTDLPAPAARGLTRQHLLGVRARLALSGPSDVYLRLNLRHGPNTDTQVRKAAPRDPDTTDLRVTFDLASFAVESDRVTAAWVDLIVSSPAGQRVDLYDIVLSRRLRALL